MRRGACDFLKIFEDINPLHSHPGFFKGWADSARELWKEQVDEDIEHLESVLDVRKSMLLAGSSILPITDDNWKWLLTVKQIEQRTNEWYSETKNLITASEISAIWKGPRTRAALVMSKVPRQDESPIIQKQGALRREHTGPMDWGVRYEPVVKQILEETLGAKIQELGRIRHRSVPRIAASPDGLFIECSKNPDLVGSLVEIKCPPTRVINDNIPFDYWCQMQLQMEVCERPSCEFVEVKFRELNETERPSADCPNGWITLEGNTETMDLRYLYSGLSAKSPVSVSEGDWVLVEAYQWEATKVRRVTVKKDPKWFEDSQNDLEAFWKDVEAARIGEWVPPEAKKKKNVAQVSSGCAIVDSGSDKEAFPLVPLRVMLLADEPSDVLSSIYDTSLENEGGLA
jgi:putative phage-type endonuclease